MRGENGCINIRRELWSFLHCRGFPTNINDDTIHREVEKIDFQAVCGKRLRRGSWRWVEGGLHSDDVALLGLLAESLGLKQGLDWDWKFEPDNYHLSVAYVNSPRTDELQKLVELYQDATMVLMQAELRAGGKTEEELQKVFCEEWKRLRKEKQRMHDETAKRLKEASKQVE